MSLSHIPVDRIPCQDSFGAHSFPSAAWSPVSVIPSDDSVAVSCTPPADLSSRLLACCAPGAVWQLHFVGGWWQTCRPLHDGDAASEDKTKIHIIYQTIFPWSRVTLIDHRNNVINYCELLLISPKIISPFTYRPICLLTKKLALPSFPFSI